MSLYILHSVDNLDSDQSTRHKPRHKWGPSLSWQALFSLALVKAHHEKPTEIITS